MTNVAMTRVGAILGDDERALAKGVSAREALTVETNLDALNRLRNSLWRSFATGSLERRANRLSEAA